MTHGIRLLWFFVALLLGGEHGATAAEGTRRGAIAWEKWSDDLFQRAASARKLVILDVGAVWCHWCHVMDQQTYADPKVAAIIKRSFLPVRVDQDAHPDLSNRYRAYGWPATIIFDANGRELSKSAGFIEPEKMRELLERVVAQPTPLRQEEQEVGPTQAMPANGLIAPEVITKLQSKHYAALDEERGGLKTKHKFLEADSVEYSLMHGAQGAIRDTEFVRRTLAFNRRLLDPVWGGVYQYSTHGDWEHPHFEKIASKQADNMRLYAHAFSVWGDPTYRSATDEIARYIADFLTAPEGAFYSSQDADVVRGEHAATYFQLSDVMRRQHGIPAVDTNIYARENGWLIRALALVSDVTGDPAFVERGKKAARWILANRAILGGGFRHGNQDVGGPFLGDTLAMGQAFLALYGATGEREWLTQANEAAEFISATFIVSGAEGAVTAKIRPGVALSPVRVLAENIELARFANLLGHYIGNGAHRDLAATALRYVGQPQRALEAIVESGILLAARELTAAPLHITVVGAKSDPVAGELFNAGRRYYSSYKRLEWWDRVEGPLVNPDVQYPELSRPAIFVCSERRCSLPLFDPAKLPNLIGQLGSPRG